MERLVGFFPVWAVLLALAALYQPGWFVPMKPAIFPLLGLIMLCMGMTLTRQDVIEAIKQPRVVLLTVLSQFVLMPLFAWLLSMLMGLPLAALAGMVLVGASAGGTASNVMCYLAKGDVALSVWMTTVSTLCAIVMMPVLTWVYLNRLIPVPVWDMLSSIVYVVLLPVTLGVLMNSYFAKGLRRVQAIFPLLSSVAILLIIATIIALNQHNINTQALPVLAAVVLHNSCGLAAGYGLAKLGRYPEPVARTMAIEIGMQNSGLSVALALKYFGVLAALPGALFSIWHNVSGSLLAFFWRRRDASR